MDEDGEVRAQHAVGLADRDVNRQPVACWGGGKGRESVLAEPCVHDLNTLLVGLDICLHLLTRDEYSSVRPRTKDSMSSLRPLTSTDHS